MECPTCKAPFQPGDKFCGNCGERLPDVGSGPAGGGPFGSAAPAVEQRSRDPFAGGGMGSSAPAGGPGAGSGGMGGQTVPCPTCGAALTPGAPKCDVCGMEFLAAGADVSAGARSGSGSGSGGGSPFGGPQGSGQQSGAGAATGGGPFGQGSGAPSDAATVGCARRISACHASASATMCLQ